MSKIAPAIAVVALTVASFATVGAEAQSPASFQPPPGAAPPWANSTTTTAPPPAPTPTTTSAAAPAAQTPRTDEPDATMPAVTSTAQPTAGPATTTPIPVAVTPMQGTTTPRQTVSMRSGPNTGFPVIGTLHPGDQLQILATANYGWVQVASPQGTGWAYGSYLAPGSTVGGPAPGAPPPGPPEVIAR
jgi:uncharacterized protein YgiM (DUF1202 family)